MLARMFEHNTWANLELLGFLAGLAEERLDATPLSDSPWSLRQAATHLVESQRGYLLLLTVPPAARRRPPLPFAALLASVRSSGDELLALARAAADGQHAERLVTTDGYLVEPWVVLVQVIQHANDHRRQIAGMLRAMGVTPPVLDAWAFGSSQKALVPSNPT